MDTSDITLISMSVFLMSLSLAVIIKTNCFCRTLEQEDPAEHVIVDWPPMRQH